MPPIQPENAEPQVEPARAGGRRPDARVYAELVELQARNADLSIALRRVAAERDALRAEVDSLRRERAELVQAALGDARPAHVEDVLLAVHRRDTETQRGTQRETIRELADSGAPNPKWVTDAAAAACLGLKPQAESAKDAEAPWMRVRRVLRTVRVSLARLVHLNHLAAAVLGVLVLVAAALLTPLPEAFGWQFFAVQGGSMEPTIPLGSVIAVRPVPADALKVGDVITFTDQNKQTRVTHRIVELDVQDGRRVATTKGDANNAADSWNVPVEQAIGRVAFHVPLLGYVMVWLASPPVKLIALALAVALFALPSFRRHTETRQVARRQRSVESAGGQDERKEPGGEAVRQAAKYTAAPAGQRPMATKDVGGDVSYESLTREIDALLGPAKKTSDT